MRALPPGPLRRSLLVCAALLGLGCVTSVHAEPPGSLRFAKTEVDFGIAEQNKEYPATVAYTNVGTATITKIRVLTDCGCYAASMSERALAPGESGSLTVRFRTLSFSGEVLKKLRIAYDDGERRQVIVRLKLLVVGGVVVDPGRLHLGEVLAGTKPEGDVNILWFDGVGKPFDVTAVEVPGQPVETKIEPFHDSARPQWRGWKVHFAYLKPPPRGVLSTRALVRTSAADHPQVVVPLTAHVVGKVWVQSRRMHLGLIRRGATKSVKLMFRPFDGTIDLGTVAASARRGILHVEIQGGARSRHPGARLLVVSVPKDAPVGSLDDVIELKTEVPGEEITEIQVRGRIFETN